MAREVVGVRARTGDEREPATLSARAIVLGNRGIGHLYAVTTQIRASQRHRARHRGTRGAPCSAILSSCSFIPPPSPPDMIRHHSRAKPCGARAPFWSMVPASDSCSGPSRRRSGAARYCCARMFAEIAAGRGAFLDARTAIGTDFPDCFPTVYEAA